MKTLYRKTMKHIKVTTIFEKKNDDKKLCVKDNMEIIYDTKALF